MHIRYSSDWGDLMIQSNFEDLRRMKAYQEKRSLPVRVIAQETGLSINTLQRVKNGTMERIDLTTLDRLCKYFAVKSLSDLIEYTPSSD